MTAISLCVIFVFCNFLLSLRMGISLVALKMFGKLTLNCMYFDLFNFHVVFENVLFLMYTVFRLAS